MALVFFEGFETVGVETGLANADTVTPRVQKRMSVENYAPAGPSARGYLTGGDGNVGYAWHMGTSFANNLSYVFPDNLQVVTGPESPRFSIGALVHIPLEPRSFNVFTLNHSGNFDPTLRVLGSTGLAQQRGASVIQSVEDVLTPGLYNYIEWQVRADGTSGATGIAIFKEDLEDYFSDIEAPSISVLEIDGVEMYLPVWSSTATYQEDDEVRWRGIEYTAVAVPDPESEVPEAVIPNVGKQPDENPEFWTPGGEEQPNTVTAIPFGSQFYFKGNPGQFYNTNSFESTTSMSISPAITRTGYHPAVDEEIIFGCQAVYKVRVNGLEVMGEVGVPTMVSGNFGTLQNIYFGTSTSTGGNDFVAYDDIYVVTDTAGGNTDLLGPVKAISLPPNNSLQEEWEPSADLGDHTNLINENGANLSTYVFSEENDWVDIYQHLAIGDTSPALAIKVEAEVQNLTAGGPNLNLSVRRDEVDITSSTPVQNTGESIVVNMFVTSPPGGGVWDTETINDVGIKMQIEAFAPGEDA